MDIKTLQLLDYISTRLSNIEKNIKSLDEKVEMSLAISRNHLIRMKKDEVLDEELNLMGCPYNDLSPAKAYSIYQNKNIDFHFLDVSLVDYSCSKRPEKILHIPLEELALKAPQTLNRTTPILIISEDGLRSIQACELLIKKGFYNVNNVSGGYLFWPDKGALNP